MSRIDIRTDGIVEIDAVVFADNGGDFEKAYVVYKEACVGLSIHSSDCAVNVHCEDIKNLIKALQKAVELGWDK